MSKTSLTTVFFVAVLESAASSGRAEPAAPRVDPLPQGAIARLASSPLRIGYSTFALSPDGRTIVTVAPHGRVRRLDAKTGRLLESRQLTDRGDVSPAQGSYAELSADGRTVALSESSYGSRRVTVWDVASGTRIARQTFREKKRLAGTALSPDGKQLALLESEDAVYRTRLRVLDLKTGQIKEIGRYEYLQPDFRFSADGKRMVVSQQEPVPMRGSLIRFFQPYTLTCFDLPAGKKLWRRTITMTGQFTLSPNGRTIIWAGEQPGLHILQADADSGKLTESFTPYSPDPDQFYGAFSRDNIAIAPDNRTVVIRHFPSKILLWDLHTRKEIRRFQTPNIDGAQISISSDGRTLLTNADYLQHWDLKTGKPFFAPPPDDALSGSFLQLAFTPDGKEILASANSGTSARWNIATGKRTELIEDNYGGSSIIRTPDGLRTVRYDFRERRHEFTVIDLATRKQLHVIHWSERDPPGDRLPHQSPDGFALTASGKVLLAVHRNLTAKDASYVTTWDVTTGCQLSRFDVAGRPSFRRSPFSPCGRWMFLGEKLRHVGSGTELFAPAGTSDERLVLDDPSVYGLVWFSEDGRLMAGHLRKKDEKSAAADTLAVWELASGQVLARFPKAGFVVQVVFAPDGRTIALLDGRGVRLGDLRNGEQLAAYAAPDVIFSHYHYGIETQGMVFAPDGRTLATGHQDGTITLWKVPRFRAADPLALTENERERAWADLANKSPEKGRAAMARLTRYPEIASFLATRFHPPPADATLVTLIKDLDSEIFAVREEASRKLRAYGAKAKVALQRTLAAAPSLEVKRRVEAILAEMAPPTLRLPLSGDALRGVRAIEVLERIGTPESRKLLRAWAEQTGDVSMAIEARLALGRGQTKF